MPNRRDLIKITALNAFTAAFAAGGLPSGTRGPAQAKVSEEHYGELRIYYDGPTGQLGSMTSGSVLMKPGMTHEPHQHPEEEFMVITEGSGEITVAGKVTKVANGSMMYSAAGTLHGIQNTGKTPLRFYFYKWKV
jgi:mannose-6-phosphate isomerase-like protein (cupin superfamily)